MIENVTTAIEGSIFVRYPGYFFAPLMLVAASLLTITWRIWRQEHRPLSLWAFLDHTFALHGWKTRSAFADVILFIAVKVLPRLGSYALALALAGLFVAALTAFVTPANAADPGVGAIITIALLLVLLLDLGDYFAHWTLHRVPFLWELHKVHHSASFLSPVTSFRVHPFEALIYTVAHSLTIAPVLAVMSYFYRLEFVDLIDLMVATNMFVLVLTLNHLKHSHFQISLGPLDYLLISPHMHQLHHSARLEHWDKNLGLVFSVWDWIFGTAVREDTKVPVVYGIGRGPEIDAQYVTFYGMLLRPIVGMFLVATRRQLPEPRPDQDFGMLVASKGEKQLRDEQVPTKSPLKA